jgi:hypothetical protein
LNIEGGGQLITFRGDWYWSPGYQIQPKIAYTDPVHQGLGANGNYPYPEGFFSQAFIGDIAFFSTTASISTTDDAISYTFSWYKKSSSDTVLSAMADEEITIISAMGSDRSTFLDTIQFLGDEISTQSHGGSILLPQRATLDYFAFGGIPYGSIPISMYVTGTFVTRNSDGESGLVVYSEDSYSELELESFMQIATAQLFSVTTRFDGIAQIGVGGIHGIIVGQGAYYYDFVFSKHVESVN